MNISFPNQNTFNTVSFGANHRQAKITKEALSKLLLDEKKSVEDISNIYNTSTQWIYELLKRFELQAPRTFTNENLKQSLPELLQEGVKLSKVSDTAGRSKSFIERWTKNKLGKTPAQIRKERLVELINGDLTDEEIAKQMDLSLIYVQKMRHKLNPSKKNPNKQARMKIVLEELANGMSVNEIEKKHGISKWTISRYKQQIKKFDKTV